MALRNGWHAVLLCLFLLAQLAVATTILDDTDPSLVYSTCGPRWRSATWRNGQGYYVGGRNTGQPFVTTYLSTWHEALGDGASVSLTFTGTRIKLNGTICNSGFNTTVDFYIDGKKVTRFQHVVKGPQAQHGDKDSRVFDTRLKYTMVDLGDLSSTQHTFKAVSVGDDSLFVVDSISYEHVDSLWTISHGLSRAATDSWAMAQLAFRFLLQEN